MYPSNDQDCKLVNKAMVGKHQSQQNMAYTAWSIKNVDSKHAMDGANTWLLLSIATRLQYKPIALNTKPLFLVLASCHLDRSEYGCGDITLTQGRVRHTHIFWTSTRGQELSIRMVQREREVWEYFNKGE